MYGAPLEYDASRSVDIKFNTTQIPEVLGQGHTVKVLGPPELVEMVKAECDRVRGMYEVI